VLLPCCLSVVFWFFVFVVVFTFALLLMPWYFVARDLAALIVAPHSSHA
jgi:hypothetical protein